MSAARLLTRLRPDAGNIRGLAVTAAAALFLAFAGAFGTIAAPLGTRLAYWSALMLIGYGLGSVVARWVFRRDRPLTGNMWLDAVLASILLSVPFTGVVAIASNLAFGATFRVVALPFLFLPVLSVSLVMMGVNLLIETRQTAAQAVIAPAPPKFLERLPLRLRGAEVWAVEAEDHYLRLHTSKGQDLILLRLADAIAELDGLEGAQVHRSWWVAREAIVDARRGDGRAILTLKDGVEVPVSRTYAGELRAKGWI